MASRWTVPAAAAQLLRISARELLARLRPGAPPPAKTFAAEVLVTFMREDFLASGGRPVRDLRTRMEAFAPPRALLPWARVEPTTLAGLPARRVVPDGAGPGVLLYLHGGGYVFGSSATHLELVARLARAAGMAAMAVDYRLAPDHPFPAAADDVLAAYQALLASGVPPGRIVLAGESAGGGLVLSVLVTARDRGVPLPAAAALLSPWVDLTLASPTIDRNAPRDFASRPLAQAWADAYLAGADPREPRASPLHAALHGLPPLLVQVGAHEMLLGEAEALAARVRDAGGPVTLDVFPAQFHGWHFFGAVLSEARRALTQAGRFLAPGIRA
jgi:acetyl esterase/lipase